MAKMTNNLMKTDALSVQKMAVCCTRDRSAQGVCPEYKSTPASKVLAMSSALVINVLGETLKSAAWWR